MIFRVNGTVSHANDFQEQQVINREVERSQMQVLREDARRKREELQINRWWAERERRYTAHLLLQGALTVHECKRAQLQLTRERAEQVIARARANLEFAKALQAQASALRRYSPPPRAAETRCQRRTSKRLEVAEQGRNQFAHRRMNVRGPLDRRIGLPCIHHVKQRVHDLVGVQSQ